MSLLTAGCGQRWAEKSCSLGFWRLFYSVVTLKDVKSGEQKKHRFSAACFLNGDRRQTWGGGLLRHWLLSPPPSVSVRVTRESAFLPSSQAALMLWGPRREDCCGPYRWPASPYSLPALRPFPQLWHSKTAQWDSLSTCHFKILFAGTQYGLSS